jgi:hypothetical protein
MYINTIPEETHKLLDSFNNDSLPLDTYLAGGTAISLQIGHRKSMDLDFFTKHEFNEDQWIQKLEKSYNLELFSKDWQTIIGDINNVKFSLFYYKYPLIKKLIQFENIKLASLGDLAAIKLDTVISRGTKRDLVDIYFLAQKFGLDNLYKFYDQKFGNFEEREIMIKKSLIYFDDAENDVDPNMLVDFKWGDLKTYFMKNVKLG